MDESVIEGTVKLDITCNVCFLANVNFPEAVVEIIGKYAYSYYVGESGEMIKTVYSEHKTAWLIARLTTRGNSYPHFVQT